MRGRGGAEVLHKAKSRIRAITANKLLSVEQNISLCLPLLGPKNFFNKGVQQTDKQNHVWHELCNCPQGAGAVRQVLPCPWPPVEPLAW